MKLGATRPCSQYKVLAYMSSHYLTGVSMNALLIVSLPSGYYRRNDVEWLKWTTITLTG